MIEWMGLVEYFAYDRHELTTHIVELPVTSALEVMCQAVVMMSKGWIASMSAPQQQQQ